MLTDMSQSIRMCQHPAHAARCFIPCRKVHSSPQAQDTCAAAEHQQQYCRGDSAGSSALGKQQKPCNAMRDMQRVHAAGSV
jgi:hypothetical protein